MSHRWQVPCSWGALFLGSVWREFLSFYHRRVRPPFFNFAQEATQRGVGKLREKLGDTRLALPRSRSNVWPRSWKRFLIDFMYGRGCVPASTVASTTVTAAVPAPARAPPTDCQLRSPISPPSRIPLAVLCSLALRVSTHLAHLTRVLRGRAPTVT